MIETNLGASKPIDPNRIVKIGYGYLWLPMVTYGYLCLSEKNF